MLNEPELADAWHEARSPKSEIRISKKQFRLYTRRTTRCRFGCSLTLQLAHIKIDGNLR